MIDFKKTHEALFFVLVSTIAVMGLGIYKLYCEQLVLSDTVSRLKSPPQNNIAIELQKQMDIPCSNEIIEKTTTKAAPWRPIQEQSKDTVVQIFAQIAEIDLLQPYKTPQQYSVCGSGFFINEEGDLITNAHVINQACAIWIQIPSLGRRIIDVELVGMTPDRDIALLRVTEEGLQIIRKVLGKVPYLNIGDSDLVHRSDEVLALGYPLGQQSLKSTTGVISGREQHMIQMDAAINPGSSGGPLLNEIGEVIGINTSGVNEAQNVGYAIPINELKIVLPDLYKTTLLRKPYLGVLYNNASDSLTEYLGNPQPGGCYIVEVVKTSTLYKAGIKPGDMLYEIDGHQLDIYGDMSVPWSEDKISIIDYVSRISAGAIVHLIVYRNGERKEISVSFDLTELPPIRKIYPGYEPIDYEVVAGMVVMQLTVNHINIMIQNIPGLAKYSEVKNQSEPVLIITHIFPNSQLYRTRTLTVGSTISELNGIKVTTLPELRDALKKSMNDKFITLRATDNLMRVSDNLLVALPFEKILEEQTMLSHDYHFPISTTVKELIAARLPNSSKPMPKLPFITA
jgi:serine protease Do